MNTIWHEYVVVAVKKIIFEMSEVTNRRSGLMAGLIACGLFVLGILFLGIVFVPLAAIVALIATVLAVKNKHWGGILVAVLAWILTVIGLTTSPVLLIFLGFL